MKHNNSPILFFSEQYLCFYLLQILVGISWTLLWNCIKSHLLVQVSIKMKWQGKMLWLWYCSLKWHILSWFVNEVWHMDTILGVSNILELTILIYIYIVFYILCMYMRIQKNCKRYDYIVLRLIKILHWQYGWVQVKWMIIWMLVQILWNIWYMIYIDRFIQ